MERVRALRSVAPEPPAAVTGVRALPADLVGLVPAAVYTACTGADGAWLYASPQIEHILGFAPEEWLADPELWLRQLHPDDRERLIAEEAAALDSDVTRGYSEYRMVAKDGRVVWVLDDVTLLHDPRQGSLQHGLLFDITARKLAEVRVAEQAAIFALVAGQELLAVTLDRIGDAVCRVTGAAGCRVTLGADRPVGPAGSGSAGVRVGDARQTLHLAVHSADGEQLGHLEAVGLPRPVQDGMGAPAHDLAWAASLVAVAVGRARQQESEARSFSLLEATLDSTADGLLVVDQAHRIVQHNQKFAELWRLPPEGLVDLELATLSQWVLPQFTDPDRFLTRLDEIHAAVEESSWDIVEFHDGRVHERYSQPQRLEGLAVGRVWSFRDVTDYRRLEAELRRRADTDDLTGLVNRKLFMTTLAESQDRSRALLLLDVDDFKTVNDGLGHLAGDHLLGELADRLRAGLGSGDLAARLGGDEFAVLVPDASAEGAREVAERIMVALAPYVDLGERALPIRASIGIALCAQGDPPTDLVRNADLAMYSAKRSGGARYAFYDPVMSAAALGRLRLRADLDRAIEEDALDVWFQPIVSLATGELVGMEALARWWHPELGAIAPPEFVGLAEETAMIDRLGRWVLTRACQQLAQVREVCGAGSLPSMSVNLSPHQLGNPRLVEEIEEILTATGLPPSALVLEITESALARSDVDVVGVLREIRALGVRLALDDFGTGHSSLSRLGTYPFDLVKIDRSFISRMSENPRDLAVVQAVLTLARAFELDVVAEGIEEDEQFRILRRLGCPRGQGYLFSRPVPAAAALDLVRIGLATLSTLPTP